MKLVAIITPDAELHAGEVRVISLTIAAENKPFKARGIRGACFAVRGIYTLSDGSTRPTSISTERKRDLAAAISRKTEEAAMGAIIICSNGFESVQYAMQ